MVDAMDRLLEGTGSARLVVGVRPTKWRDSDTAYRGLLDPTDESDVSLLVELWLRLNLGGLAELLARSHLAAGMTWLRG